MLRSDLPGIIRRALPIVLAGFACTVSHASPQKPTDKPVIALEPPAGEEASAQMLSTRASTISHAPANFRDLGDATPGVAANVQALTLRFSAETKLLSISSTPDFIVEQGGSCVEGNVYSANDTCRLLVRFSPKGAGHRLGKVTITHSASPTPMYVGLGGNGYTPVVSFTPAKITTVPASISGGVGIIESALNLAVDGGDTLYVADTGHNMVRILDSGGAFKTIASTGVVAPVGVAADSFGEVYFSEPTQNLVYEIFEYGSVLQLNGTGFDACTVAAPCSMASESVFTPGMMGIDSGNQLFFEDGNRGAAVAVVQPYPATLARLFDPFTYQTAKTGVFTVDQYDNLYSVWSISGLCQINQQTYSDAANGRAIYKKVAGGKFCGFAGDGGQARNAEIGATIGQMAFDIAGNMYFTDASNQRVRRIDSATGIIRTIAGSGAVGNGGDSGAATVATLNAPTGLAVDSQGQVYIINYSSAAQVHQVIRKLEPYGYWAYGSLLKGSTSLKTFNVANSGNSALAFTKTLFTGANIGDFSIDPASTTCNFSTGNLLGSGESCTVGVNFTPAASGPRAANLVLYDNTVNGTNTIIMSGSGALPSSTVKIMAPASPETVTAGTTVKFAVTVTSSGTAPTGSVTFKVDGAAFGNPVALSSGNASVNLTGLSVKTHTISATYSGNGDYSATTVSQTVTVEPGSTIEPKPIKGPFTPASVATSRE